MYISKDKSGIYMLSVEYPKRMTCHWKSPDNKYMILNKIFGEMLFPYLDWESEPEKVNISIESFDENIFNL